MSVSISPVIVPPQKAFEVMNPKLISNKAILMNLVVLFIITVPVSLVGYKIGVIKS
jgi:hypothetical protein